MKWYIQKGMEGAQAGKDPSGQELPKAIFLKLLISKLLKLLKTKLSLDNDYFLNKGSLRFTSNPVNRLDFAL